VCRKVPLFSEQAPTPLLISTAVSAVEQPQRTGAPQVRQLHLCTPVPPFGTQHSAKIPDLRSGS